LKSVLPCCLALRARRFRLLAALVALLLSLLLLLLVGVSAPTNAQHDHTI
jgi:hypothetical protein